LGRLDNEPAGAQPQDSPTYLYRALIQTDVRPLNRERFADPQSGGDQEETRSGRSRSIDCSLELSQW
jgi:hypothetical protein